jgi:hypothetical protein
MADPQKKIEESVDYWLRSISLKAPNSTVILVGTHLDQMVDIKKPKQLPENLLKEYGNLISKSFFVSNSTGIGIKELKQYLIKLAMEHQIEIPASWLVLGNTLNQMKEENSWITIDKVLDVMKSEKFKHKGGVSIENRETKTALSVLHNLGYLLYYQQYSSEVELSIEKLVILDPQWLVNILKAVVTMKDVKSIENGWLSHNKICLSNLWPNCDSTIHSFLLSLLYRFGIAIESKGQSLIPCKLELVPPTIINEFPQLLFELEFPQILPGDLFPTFIASPKVIHYLNLDNISIWRDAAILSNEDGLNYNILVRTSGKSILLLGNTISKELKFICKMISLIYSMISKNWSGLIYYNSLFLFFLLGLSFQIKVTCFRCFEALGNFTILAKCKELICSCNCLDNLKYIQTLATLSPFKYLIQNSGTFLKKFNINTDYSF